MPEPAKVRAMFGRIAPRYDLLNRVLSGGIDRRWRKRLLREAGDPTARRCVDVCCGTGDLALTFARAGASVVGVDFTSEMLAIAEKRRTGPVRFVEGDALRLPLADGVADLSMVAFGIRNVGDRGVGLAELRRVVRPGGRVLVLEFSMPRSRLLGALYRFYFTRILPVLGGWISGDRAAYRYLPDTVQAWPSPEELDREMEAAGLTACGHHLLSGGIACLSFGTVPAGADGSAAR